jgi:hypothetical protein
MRVTLLGHASVLVETQGRHVLVDPVFEDPFAEGAAVSCPARRVDVGQLPKIDLVVLSDAAPDRLDVAALAQIPRDCPVVAPKDPTATHVLERLGFQKVRPTAAGERLRFPEGFELLTTPSTRRVTEYGIFLKDASGSFWDPVACMLSRPIVEQVRAAMGPTDLFLAPYAFQDFAFVGSQRAGFPGQFLRGCVACAKDVAPALVVPGSAGLRFDGPLEWTNAFLFPISRQRFLSELERAAPDRRASLGNPGDVFEIAGRRVERRPNASPLVEMIADDTDRLEFDPTGEVPPLTDPNLDGYSADVLESQVTTCFEELAAFVRGAWPDRDPLVADHHRAHGVYGLGVVFPDGRERWIRIAFRAEGPTIETGTGLVQGALDTHRMAASVLTARARYERSYHFTGGLVRVTIISPAKVKDGEVAVEPRQPPDLMEHWIRSKPPGWEQHRKRMLDFRLAREVSG